MGIRVDARDVLDPNAKTLSLVRGLVTAYYRRTGPNRWDDYELVSVPEEQREVVEILPQLKVQLEDWGPVFRVRLRGRVVRVEWAPDDGVRRRFRRDPDGLRQHFVDEHLEVFDEAQGRGAAAVIAKKLR